MSRSNLLPLVFAVAALSGAAVAAAAEAAKGPDPNHYEAFAGEPVKSLQFASIYGWEPIDEEHVVLMTGVRTAWMLDLSGLCLDQHLTVKIGVTSFGSRIHSGFDKVQTSRGECRITQIRKIDMAAYDEAKRKVMGGDLELGNGSEPMAAEAIERPASDVDTAERSGG